MKALKGSSRGKAQRGQYLPAMGLDCYKWYQSQTPGDVPVKRLFPKEGRHEAVCEQGRWAPKGVDLVGVPH